MKFDQIFTTTSETPCITIQNFMFFYISLRFVNGMFIHVFVVHISLVV